MRNWNWNTAWNGLPLPGPLPDYLWGIETEGSTWCLRGVLSFQTTYEELKPLRNNTGPRQFRASRLPMRNWNSWWVHVCELVKYDASRLPMRNWNTAVLKTKIGRILASRLPMRNWNFRVFSPRQWEPGFQTTYEELKPIRGVECFQPGCCFQTTYEELKLWKYRSFVRRCSFQTTYEELKHPRSCQMPA